MKCVLCDGVTSKKRVEYKEQGISFGMFNADVCTNCGEKYFDEETTALIQQKSKQLGLFGIAKRVKVAELGTSLAIRIPKELATMLHLVKGKEVLLVPQGTRELRVQT